MAAVWGLVVMVLLGASEQPLSLCSNTGAPLNASDLLLEHQAALKRCGFQPSPRRPSAMRDLTTAEGWRAHGQLPVHEAADWPRPKQCSGTNTLSSHRKFEPLRVRYLISRQHALVVYTTLKAGFTALGSWWHCALHESSRRYHVDAKFFGNRSVSSVVMSRHPLSRLPSAYKELLKWLTVTVVSRPALQAFRMPDLERLYWILGDRGAENKRYAEARASGDEVPPVELYAAVVRAVEATCARWIFAGITGNVTAALWHMDVERIRNKVRFPLLNVTFDEKKRLKAFLQATECDCRYPLWSHAASSSAFSVSSAIRTATSTQPREWRMVDVKLSNPSPRVQHVLHQERLVKDLFAVMRSANISVSKGCRLRGLNPSREPIPRDENDTALDTAPSTRGAALSAQAKFLSTMQRSSGFPRSEELRRMVHVDKDLTRAICRAHFQDFVCFGYSLPDPCQRNLHPNWECEAADGP